jgi:hypothetical protein
MDLYSYHMRVSWSLHGFAFLSLFVADHCRLCTGKIHRCVNISEMQIVTTNKLIASTGRHDHTSMIIATVVWHTGSLVCDSVLCRIVLLSCLQGRCVQHAQTAGNMFCAIVLYRKWFVLYRILLSRWVCCPCHCFPGMLIRCLLRSTVRMSVYERRKRAKQVMYIVCIDCVVCNLCNL